MTRAGKLRHLVLYSDPSNINLDFTDLEQIRKAGEKEMSNLQQNNNKGFYFAEVISSRLHKLFDLALDQIHYAGSCQRVGRCMRLAFMEEGKWAGGMVLGSTFPNILVRDEFLGLRKFVVDYKERGLRNPWMKENTSYWDALQKVVNHARTFVFPQFQGKGVGIRAHGLLLSEGIKLWEAKYASKAYAVDTLCTMPDSGLFRRNGWTCLGRTKGYSSDQSGVFSKRVDGLESVKNNVGLCKRGRSWWVWAKVLKEGAIDDI